MPRNPAHEAEVRRLALTFAARGYLFPDTRPQPGEVDALDAPVMGSAFFGEPPPRRAKGKRRAS